MTLYELIENNERMIEAYIRHGGGLAVLKKEGDSVKADWVDRRMEEVVRQLKLNNVFLRQLDGIEEIRVMSGGEPRA